MKNLVFFAIVFLISTVISNAQCVRDTNNIYRFTDNNINYEVIKENKTWAAAQACAVARGGQLVRIDSLKEQDSIFANVNRAGITTNNTVAPDGGGAAYVWLAGNDTLTEGDWVWDNPGGTNDQFWLGARSGSAVGGLFNNWGNEPDNYQGQNALGLALTAWPYGVAGEWNDVDEHDTLYYIIEYPIVTSLEEQRDKQEVNLVVYPNPATSEIYFNFTLNEVLNYQIVDLKGAVVKTGKYNGSSIKIAELEQGSYWIKLEGITKPVYFQKL